MSDVNPTCANCGIPIRWRPTVVDGRTYCCLGCAQGGPCECDYARLPQHADRAQIVVWRQVISAHWSSKR